MCIKYKLLLTPKQGGMLVLPPLFVFRSSSPAYYGQHLPPLLLHLLYLSSQKFQLTCAPSSHLAAVLFIYSFVKFQSNLKSWQNQQGVPMVASHVACLHWFGLYFCTGLVFQFDYPKTPPRRAAAIVDYMPSWDLVDETAKSKLSKRRKVCWYGKASTVTAV